MARKVECGSSAQGHKNLQDGSVETRGEGHGEVENAKLAGIPAENVELKLESDGRRFRFNNPTQASAGFVGWVESAEPTILAALVTALTFQQPDVPKPPPAIDVNFDFKDVDIVLGSHVSNDFSTSYSTGKGTWSGLVSIQYFFHGKAAHAAMAPWDGRSALDAVELMDISWDFNREHLRTAQRSHRVIINGGDQPNVVPSEAAVWYYFREMDYAHIKSLYELGNTVAGSAAKSTGTTVDHKLVGSAWPPFFNKVIAEAQQKNIESVGMPVWSEADQTLAKSLQKEIGAKVEGLKSKVEPLEEPAKTLSGGGSDDVGDISWNVPMVYLMFPANIPNLPGHSWPNAVAMATPISHKGSTAGAKVQALTALDFMLRPQLVTQAWDYFRSVQTHDVHYESFLAPTDQPAIELNKEKMQKFAPDLKKFYFDPSKYKTYLDQLGITYPTVRATP